MSIMFGPNFTHTFTFLWNKKENAAKNTSKEKRWFHRITSARNFGVVTV